eukprot:5279493-Amphidinium_carterae.3
MLESWRVSERGSSVQQQARTLGVVLDELEELLKKKWEPVVQLIHEAARLCGGNRRQLQYAAIQLNMTSPKGLISHTDQNNVGSSDIIALDDYQ